MFIIEKLPANSPPTDKIKCKQWLFPISLFSPYFYKYESPQYIILCSGLGTYYILRVFPFVNIMSKAYILIHIYIH